MARWPGPDVPEERRARRRPWPGAGGGVDQLLGLQVLVGLESLPEQKKEMIRALMKAAKTLHRVK